MSIRVSGTHFEGPILGSDKSVKGLLNDVPLASVDQIRSPYQVYVEDFRYALVDGGFAGTGWTLTDVGTATSPTEVVDPETGYLLINPGTKADSGTELQKILLPSQATYLVPASDVLGPITSTATLMDNKEIFFYTRVGPMATTTAWDGKAIIGWCTTDTSLLSPTTGEPTIVAGGGFGFHIGEDGVLGYFCSPDAVTTVTDTSVDYTTLTTAATPEWTTLGARMRVIDASASTGYCDFFVNGTKVGTIANATCMDSTEEFAFSLGILNGPALVNDLAVDWIVTGITRPGLTYPYSSGNW
jgi:hypothetical protein